MTDHMIPVRRKAQRLSAKNAEGTVRAFYPYWDSQYRPYLIEAIRRLPIENFDYKPRPEMLTSQQIIVHIAEAERGWIDNIVNGGPYEEMVVPADDPSQGWKSTVEAPDHDALLDLLEKHHRSTQRWMEAPASELARDIPYTRPDGEVVHCTLHWVLDHVQEHEIHHRGQLNLYLRLLGIEPPSI
jgi:uncharacterized damage-inducible protein DinB